MKILLPFVLLRPLIASCNIYQSMKALKTMADIDKKETKLQGEMEKEQREIDRVSKEIEQLKKDEAK